jgi:hypothetical protein
MGTPASRLAVDSIFRRGEGASIDPDMAALEPLSI